ncbi:hypothetical protein [Campylobacter jejuni]|uniref:Uncharacterized protein n=3 Tax=Campylobacter jejuni TaxID=197 RepID=A0A430YXP1_CAMJU|nr:hypothetical protein [Campylobacter jejuni]RTJ09208.1 hypothetical protein C3H92_08670 [Campylobacter jejuni]RTJ19913.1 hypothetical protein C3H88_08585 [Campylobacter jejuni]RTJ30376.1 hypothetical protein C3H81_08750 [Campylobacter jejuni]RTJ34755.1 hypothetical protein C3H77_08760 [Campylobacter jejuni]RTJ40475.1 hypothetical protein C3H73_08895 [Campylobacter jejuni]
MKTQNISANQVSFHLLSKKTFSDEKYLNAWSLKGNRLNLQDWLDFKKANENNFYNKHLENTLKAMQEFKTFFSIDQFEGINLSKDDEWLNFLPQNYTQIYNRLCRDKSKYILHRYYQKDELIPIGFIENLSPNLPFWNESGENFSQDKIDTFIENDLLEPHFSQYDVYFNSSLNLTFNFNEENLNYLLHNYDYRVKKSFIDEKKLQEKLNLDKENKIILELEYMFLNLCKGISADYAFMDFSYFFVAYDYLLNSKNNPLKSYPLNLNDFIYERSFKEALEKYTSSYFLNYFSKELLEKLDTQNLTHSRYNRYIINYDKLPKNLEEENIQGLLSKQKDININFVNFIDYQDYVYNNKDDFWNFSSEENSILWEKFLSKNTLKPFPLNFDCSLEEKFLYAKDEQLENILKSHKAFHG